MDVLVHLAGKPGEVVSIDELIARIWDGRATEGSVYRTINQLRRALEGDSVESRYIETIRKRGYRLIAPVKATSSAAVTEVAPASRGAASRPSIAVLPFENLSPEKENAFFADGMHGEVLSQLSKISSLRVISRTSVLEYRDSPKNIRQIAKELDVDTILEGTVQRAGGAARINVQLIDAARDEHLWAQVYDRALTAENVFAIQSEISTAVAEALQAALLPDEAVRISRVPTQSSVAYDFYLSGNSHLYRANYSRPDSWLEAIDAFERAVDEDPDFALAWAALSRAHVLVYHLSIDRTHERLQSATHALERARALDPDLPEFHLAAGEYHYRSTSDMASALAEFDLAARGMPDAPELLFSRALVYKRLGRWEQALETFEMARKLDPRSPRLIFNQADTYLAVREYEVAHQYLQQIVMFGAKYMHADLWQAYIPLIRDGDVTALQALPDVNEHWVNHLKWLASLYQRDFDASCKLLDRWQAQIFGWPWSHVSLASAYGVTYDLAGRHDESRQKMSEGLAMVEEALAASRDDPRLFIAKGEAHAILGDRDEAVRAAQQAMAMRPRSVDVYSSLILQIDSVMRILVRAGAFDEAIAYLDDYLETRGGSWSIEGLLPDPRLDPIRDDQRFQDVVEKHRRP